MGGRAMVGRCTVVTYGGVGIAQMLPEHHTRFHLYIGLHLPRYELSNSDALSFKISPTL